VALDVFVSVGRTSTQEQEQFTQRVLEFLRANNLNPEVVGRTAFSSKQPLQHVQELMVRCHGTVVIAFERIFIERGVEQRGSASAKTLEASSVPTVWNQLEAAMAYCHEHPLLVIVEQGLRSEGLLERGYDWHVQSVNLRPDALSTPEFQGVFADWRQRVEQRSNSPKKSRELDAEKLKLVDLWRSLTVKQAWAAGIAIVVAFSGVAGTAYKAGNDTQKSSQSTMLSVTCSNIRSSDGVQQANVKFRNLSSSRVSGHWIDPVGASKQYFVLSAKSELVQPSFVGHAWCLRDADSGHEIKAVTIRNEDDEVIIEAGVTR
jgi:hypothetical protein